jgi:hypothetical protein
MIMRRTGDGKNIPVKREELKNEKWHRRGRQKLLFQLQFNG